MVNSTVTETRILVLGLTAAGAAGLPPALVARVHQADVLVGGERQLNYFPHARGERVVIRGDVVPAVERLRRARHRGERAVVLASGDPMCYGIGVTLRRHFPPDALEVIPAPSAFQLAFAALAEPWQDAVLLSAHGRPLADVLAQARAAAKAAILTDTQATPAVIARELMDAGLPPETRCAVCENLGGPEQRVVRGTLAQVATQTFATLNVFVVWPQADGGVPFHRRHGPPPTDAAFSTSGGLLTKREVRLLALAELDLRPGDVMWDIGAGSGAVSIEAAYRQPAARVYAVERRPALVRHMRANLRRYPAPNVRLIVGEAPEACAAWPTPHAVFLGGTGGRLNALLLWAREALVPHGRLVINLATVDHLPRIRTLLPGVRVVQVAVSRGVDIQGHLRFQALNPVFIAVWQKTAPHSEDTQEETRPWPCT